VDTVVVLALLVLVFAVITVGLFQTVFNVFRLVIRKKRLNVPGTEGCAQN
jgi:hypothetical protein